ncbi:MAG: pilE [Nevskia sp.]|nr:pilE [Nevskia sp.]
MAADPPEHGAMMSAVTQRGYTLKELVIVVLIISILSAIAVRSYRKSVLKNNRQNGVACLIELQKRMEDYYSRNAGTTASNSTSSSNTGYPLLAQIGYGSGNCPVAEGNTTLYTVALVLPNTVIANCSNCYKLTATGVSAQARDGALLLSVDPRSTAASTDIYHKQHITPGGVTLEGWIFQPGQ